ncbi:MULTISPECIES: cell division protein FtsA [Clostridium]|uniref:cell division protein FtsA n=1 Tax=Clostridium TaxID=1485 RepID=UPI00069D2551|nr:MULTISPECIES: cell division protein FtsA [Clostridium]KOF56089.1 cell division protein FtsA [Clostridium sp. DMHC 10]MCD2346063.1 cell division protein FtsA [Clostridium guangxiense]
MDSYIVGLDIGSSKICAAAGKITKRGTIEILGITSSDCKGLKKSIIVNIDKTAESIRECIEKLQMIIDITIDNIYISLPGSICGLVHNKAVIAVSSDDREIKNKDVERLLESAKLISVPANNEIIGVEPQQFIVDGYDNIKDPIGMSGMRLEADVHVITAQSAIVNNFIKSVAKAGYNVKGICFAPKVVSNVVLSSEDRELGCALIDVGAETIDITIIKNDNICYEDFIPLGGNNITNDISIGLKIPFNEAEKLKFKFADIRNGNSGYAEKVSVKLSNNEVTSVDCKFLKLIIKSRVEELYEFIKKKIVDSGYYNEISNVVIVGGGIALIRGADELGNNILGKSVEIGSPNYVGASNPMYAGAVGITYDICNSVNIENDDFSSFSNEDEIKSIWNKSSKKSQENINVFSRVKDFFTDLF